MVAIVPDDFEQRADPELPPRGGLGRLSSTLIVLIGLALVTGLAFARAPFTRVPDALFVSDGFGYYLYLPSLWIDGDLDLANQTTRLPYEGSKAFFKVSESTGRTTNQFPVGCALLWSPFFVVADAAVVGLRMVGVMVPRSGFGYLYELPVYLGSFLYGLAGLWLLRRTLRRLSDPWIADLSLIAIFLATPTSYYLVLEPNMSHSVALFLVCLWIDRLVEIALKHDHRFGPWVCLGIVLGLVGLVRPYSAVLGLTAIPTSIRASHGRPLGGFTRLATVFVISLVVMTPQFLVWKTLYGSWLVVPKGSGYEQIRWSWYSLTSFATSVFVLWPIYLPAGLGLMFASVSGNQTDAGRFTRTLAPCVLVVLVVFTVLVANSRDWMLGTAFGQRRMVDWAPFFAIGLATFLSKLKENGQVPPRIVVGCAGGLAFLNTLLVVLYLLRLVPEYGRVL